MIRNRFVRLSKAMLATLVAVGLVCAMGCSSSPEPADDPIPAEPAEQPAEDYEDPYGEGEEAPPAEPAEPAPAPAPTPQDPMAPQAQGDLPQSSEDVSEEQVESFADAYMSMQDIRATYEPQMAAAADADEARTLQQEAEVEVVEVVETSGLSIEEFEAIAALLEYDQDLQQRIQTRVDSMIN